VVEQVYLIRHGETAWSLGGQHTGRTDIPLTARGEAQARQVGERLRGLSFTAVLTSPLQRARRTCELAGLDGPLHVDQALREWDYGQYEGLTSVEIRRQQANWDVFRDGGPGGESPPQVSARADGVLARLRQLEGRVAVFSHGHFLRSLGVRWIELPIQNGRNFGLAAGAVCLLGYEHRSLAEPAIELWNATA
jgi:probable phosphoglycerate mutase